MDRPSPEATRGTSDEAETANASPANKRLRIVTRCAVLEEFLATFADFADDSSLFIVTNKPRAKGLKQSFVIQLKDGETIMKGDVEVIDAITNNTGPDGRNGMRLSPTGVDEGSRAVHKKLLERRNAKRSIAPAADNAPDSVAVASEMRPAFDDEPKTSFQAAPLGLRPLPRAIALAPPITVPGAATPTPPPSVFGGAAGGSSSGSTFPADGERAPGAAYQLPANPFEGITAEALESFVECTLYEERLPRPEGDAGFDTPPPSQSGSSLSAGPPPLFAVPAVGPVGVPPPPPAPLPSSAPMAPTFSVPLPPLAPTFGLVGPSSGREPLSYGEAAISGVHPAAQPPKSARRPWIVGLFATAVVSSIGSLAIAYFAWGKGENAPSGAASTSASALADVRTAQPPSTATASSSTSATPTAEPATPLIARDCRANVRSYPDGAAILWNKEALGITPLADTPVPCGPAKVSFELRGYAQGERSAMAVVGKAAGVFLRLSPVRVTVDVTSTPPGAQLLVDGRSMGRTPAKVSLMGLREATVVVTMPRYIPWTTRITPEPPGVSLHADLQKK